jgi:hypothetical protein
MAVDMQRAQRAGSAEAHPRPLNPADQLDWLAWPRRPQWGNWPADAAHPCGRWVNVRLGLDWGRDHDD